MDCRSSFDVAERNPMLSVPADLRQRLQRFGQEHVLAFWDHLNDDERRELLDQLKALDLEELQRLYGMRDQKGGLPSPAQIQPIARAEPAESPEQAAQGETALRAGQVAAL